MPAFADTISGSTRATVTESPRLKSFPLLFGRFLRRSSLDELPQLWNVLRGEMALVGPRPVVEEELAAYGLTSAVLLSVRPGITGAWAVGGRHEVGYPERCRVELRYVREWTLGTDVGILVRTLRAVLHPGGLDAG